MSLFRNFCRTRINLVKVSPVNCREFVHTYVQGDANEQQQQQVEAKKNYVYRNTLCDRSSTASIDQSWLITK